MININETLIVQLINFLVLLFILNKLLLQPVLKLIGERDAFKVQAKDDIKDLEARIEALKEEFIGQENDARRNAASEKTDLIHAGMTEAEKFLDVSRGEVSGIRRKADAEVAAEVEKTQPLLKTHAEQLVAGIAEKIIGRRVET